MSTGTKQARDALAAKRLINVLRTHVVATGRTLEQKISDAGPGNQRIDPHVLQNARRSLLEQGLITRITEGQSQWLHLTSADPDTVAARLQEQRPHHLAMLSGAFSKRLGQTLEIAVFRALRQQPALFSFGAYTDLDAHDDSTLYSKEEPPSNIGPRSCGNRKLDFLVMTQSLYAGIEVKNVREWMYPNRGEVRELLSKATALDVVPVLIARRIPFVTFRLLNACGVIIHQTYNQLFPYSDSALAASVRHKNLLGYHDVRVGNEPDTRLTQFIGTNLPKLIPALRPRFDVYKDLLAEYGCGGMTYPEFAARVRRRSEGRNEDHDWPDEDEDEQSY